MKLKKQRHPSRKLLVIISALIIIMLMISFFSVLLTYHLLRHTERLSDHDLPGFQNILETNRDLYHLLLAERSLFLVEPGSQKQLNYLEEYQNKLIKTEDNLKRLKVQPMSEADRLKIIVIEGGWNTWKSWSSIVVSLIQKGTIEGQTRARVLSLNFSADLLYNKLVKPLNELQGRNYLQIYDTRTQIRIREKRIIIVTCAMTAAAAGTGVILFLVSLRISSEIKARRKAEGELAKEKEILDLFVNSSSDYIFFKDLSGKYTRINPKLAKWFGLDHQERAIGKNEMDYLHEDDALKAVKLDNNILRYGKGIVDKEVYVKQPGSSGRQWFLATRQLLLDGEGQVCGTYGIYKDITAQRHRHEEQVKTIQKQKETVQEIETEKRMLEHHFRQVQKLEALGTLAGGIAHDFNNILSSVIGYVEMAIEDADENTPQASYLEAVLVSGLRAKDLVDQILTFARQSEPELQPVRINLIAKETLRLLRSTLPANVSINASLECDSLVMADPSQLHQVFMNLCTNAVQSMGDQDGQLIVQISPCHVDASFAQQLGGVKTGEYLRLVITDTGEGISSDVINKIFEPYFTTKKRGKGTGLGLSVVHGIVNRCGGAIQVDSVLGKGTTMSVYLPTTQKTVKGENTGPKEVLAGNESILVVEDELLISGLWSQILTRQGYDVTVLNDSVGALELIRKKPERFDLVLLDLSMPRMTGDHLAAAIFELRADLPLILCTGDGKNIPPDRAKKIGIQAVAQKPIMSEELKQLVRKTLDQRDSFRRF
jgi:PAS domain S-box-containing protein